MTPPPPLPIRYFVELYKTRNYQQNVSRQKFNLPTMDAEGRFGTVKGWSFSLGDITHRNKCYQGRMYYPT